MPDTATFQISGGINIPPHQRHKPDRLKYAQQVGVGMFNLVHQIEPSCTVQTDGVMFGDCSDQNIHFDLEIMIVDTFKIAAITSALTKVFAKNQNRDKFHYLSIYDHTGKKTDLIEPAH